MNSVLIMAGGTGGHIFPGLAVAECLGRRGVDVSWLGADGGMESQLVPDHGINFYSVPIRGLRGNGLKGWLLAPWVVGRAVFAAMKIIRSVRPRCVLSMGGYVAGPGGVAAWLLRRPLVVHEQNSVAGLTNRVLAVVAKRVLTGFDHVFADRSKAQRVGNPVRAEFAEAQSPEQRFAGRDSTRRLLVLGGSQGARHLNQTVPVAMKALGTSMAWNVRHQCGRRHEAPCRDAYSKAQLPESIDVSIEPFIEDMAQAYQWADLVIARAGALTIAELSAIGCAALLVPFPYAVDDHQTTNAEQLRQVGAARVVNESTLSAANLAEQLTQLSDRDVLLTMAQAARTLGHADATERVADACLEVARP